ncbi:hypothetical protein QBC40DRAFT_262496 [Triangularia verruculosa]|uniref:Uncharacterized protein n=1 Tax=Triangularia verruculosa TaxID=2587418 RepID=A0AAN6XQ75_9PEZI|nr:hypothetical protein QBC40DRAFT_262496 [Triangularia verruculosa]
MHPLTTSDLAFLLCTSSPTSPTKAPISLRTTYGLHITIFPDGSLSISTSLQKQSQHSPLSSGSLDSILNGNGSLPIPKSLPPQNRHYLLSPDFTTSTYLWSPSSQSLDEWLPTDETLLESLYSGGLEEEGSWFDAYLDWVGRAEDQLHRPPPQLSSETRESNDSFISVDSPSDDILAGSEGTIVFRDEGERTLWMVEGVLLASWLALQEGVEGVGYRPGGEGRECGDEGVYLLEREGTKELGEVVGVFLGDVRS